MSPYDLRGPPFLLFYSALCAAVAIALVLAKRALEGGDAPKLGVIDPYMIAYLRAGANEALRVLVLSMLDRGLLVRVGDSVQAVPGASARARRPIERKLLEQLELPTPGRSVYVHRDLCAGLRDELRAKRLLVSARELAHRLVLGLVALALLGHVALTKVLIAFVRGKHNVAFLIVLALVAGVMVLRIAGARRTALGDRVLSDMRKLCRHLADAAPVIQHGGASSELALLAAIYGLNALAGDAKNEALLLFPQAARSSSWSGSSGSCGSSCGSSCGGGCGGGGCGGCGGS
jgi:uncharacterized protein (TIGR04222 family)